MMTNEVLKQDLTFTATPGVKIPGSGAAPMVLTAAALVEMSAIQIAHTMDKVVNVYIGPDNALILVAKVFGAPDNPYITPCLIPKGSRISIRSADANEIQKGTVNINLIAPAWRV